MSQERTQVVLETISLLSQMIPNFSSTLESLIESRGIHHNLLDIADPNAEALEADAYGFVLDDFEQELKEALNVDSDQ